MKRPKLTVGIDEAGRGAVLGPLVVAGCALDLQAHRRLAKAGVADSKAFGPPAKAQVIRIELAEQIRAEATWSEVRVATAAQVDQNVRQNRLNGLERALAEDLLQRAPANGRVVLDGRRVFGPLCARVANAEAMDKADQHELSVAAASILAKTTRDAQFAELRALYEPDFGPIGGQGYPNRATERFLNAFVERHGHLPPQTRLSWQWAPLLRFTTAEQRGEPPSFSF